MEPEQIEEEETDAGDIAADFLEEVVAAMHMSAGIEIDEEEDGTFRLELVGEDAGNLIGRYGDTLNSLQYLVTLVTQKRTGEHVRILLDAEGYRDRREAALVEQARSFAAEVIRTGQEIELDPLGSFERRIIHNALMDHPDVETYSEGEEPERYVVIGPRKK
jgi:spoIIIJ-associated protein